MVAFFAPFRKANPSAFNLRLIPIQQGRHRGACTVMLDPGHRTKPRAPGQAPRRATQPNDGAMGRRVSIYGLHAERSDFKGFRYDRHRL